MSRDQVSQYALTASIDEGGFEDVKFFAFSRRTAKGRVFAPRGLFGNSTCIRKAAPHFDGGVSARLSLFPIRFPREFLLRLPVLTTLM